MKRKVGLIVGYNGEGFLGLQYNKDLNTIEKCVLEALLKHECITEINSLDTKKIELKSSSRTDKGVHASFNLISAKIIVEPSKELFEKLREELKHHNIHLYKLIKLTKRFVGHKMARSRIYKYIVPTYFLKPDIFEIDVKSLDNKNESIIINNKNEINNKESNDSSETDLKKEDYNRIFRSYPISIIKDLKGFRSNNIRYFNDILQFYVGTKNFHNFTLKSSPGDPNRIIKAIQASEPFVVNDIEYTEITLHGQSFLLHQIRKMISFAVLNYKYLGNDNPESIKRIEDNFKLALSEKDTHISKAPSQYLFLNHIFFDNYNEKDVEKIEIDEKEKANFEKERILPVIFKETNILEWFKYFDSVYFHHDKFNYLKEVK